MLFFYHFRIHISGPSVIRKKTRPGNRVILRGTSQHTFPKALASHRRQHMAGSVYPISCFYFLLEQKQVRALPFCSSPPLQHHLLIMYLVISPHGCTVALEKKKELHPAILTTCRTDCALDAGRKGYTLIKALWSG